MQSAHSVLTLGRETVPSQAMERDGEGLHHAPQNSAQFQTYGLFISGLFHLAFLDHG